MITSAGKSGAFPDRAVFGFDVNASATYLAVSLHGGTAMTQRTILIYPDRRLRTKAREVAEIGNATRGLADDMLETMYAAPGIGLAGPQIGVMRRILVMDCSGKEEEPAPRVLINPELVWQSETTDKREEGCLSMPNQFADVVRPDSVRVGFVNLEGVAEEETFNGIWARCVQHEIDHLDGRLFIDRISLVKRQLLRRRLAKEQRVGRD